MIRLEKTSSENKDFLLLVKELDVFLTVTDGDDHAFYDQFNSVTAIKHVVVAYLNDIPVGCGAIKQFDSKTMEVKRMYTRPSSRGNGIASEILMTLEHWASSLEASSCILETGIRQVEAIGLYLKRGYHKIDNYGQYIDIDESLCFRKELNK